ncbi:hypothetical protein Tco_0389329 [Tanacetum coccineum]
MQVNKNLTKIQAQKTKLKQGILKKKMNLLKTALSCQYGIPILPQTHLLQNQIKRKNLEQETKSLVTQAGAAKSSSTNIFSTVSTTAKASGTNFVNTVSIPVSTASPNEGLSISDTTNFQEDDSEIPPLEDIHKDSTDGIFTYSSYDDEGAEADDKCSDKSKITRKQSKASKHGHENQKSSKRSQRSKALANFQTRAILAISKSYL